MKTPPPIPFTRSIATLGGVVLLIAAWAAARPPESAPQPSQSQIREILDREFTELAGSCFGGAKWPKKFGPKLLPAGMKKNFEDDLTRTDYEKVQGENLSALFRTMFDAKDAGLTGWEESSRRLDINLADAFQPDPDFNNLVFENSCAQLAHVGLSDDVKAGLGPAQLKQALSLEFNGSERQDLLVIRGVFQSPVWQRVDGADPSAKGAVLAAIWDKYAKKTSYFTSPPYILATPALWMIKTIQNIQRTGQAKLEGSASFGFAVVKAAADASYLLDTNQTMKLGTFQIYVLPMTADKVGADGKPAQKHSFEQLPPGAEIEKFFTRLRASAALAAGTKFISEGATAPLGVVIPGISDKWCRGAWDATAGDLLDVQQATFESFDSLKNECKIRVDIRPKAGVLANRPQIDVVLSLKSAASELTVASVTKAITLSAKANLVTSSQPNLIPAESSQIRQDTIAGKQTALQFTVPFTLLETQVEVDKDALRASFAAPINLDVKCGDKTVQLSGVAHSVAAGYELVFSIPSSAGLGTASVDCSVSAPFQLTKKADGVQVARVLTARFIPNTTAPVVAPVTSGPTAPPLPTPVPVTSAPATPPPVPTQATPASPTPAPTVRPSQPA